MPPSVAPDGRPRRTFAQRVRAGVRRLAAFGIDYAVIVAYIGFLTALAFAGRAMLSLPLAAPSSAAEKLLGHAVAFLTLTLPVALYFALAEASPAGATLGKRAVGLRVTALDGSRLPLARSLIRSAVKFLPWEVAHTAIWHTPGQPFVSAPAAWNVAGYAIALLCVAWYVAALFWGEARPPYDRASGAMVIQDRADRATTSDG